MVSCVHVQKYDEEMLCCCPKSIFTPNSPWFTHIDPAAWWLTLVHQGFTLKYSTTFHNISSSHEGGEPLRRGGSCERSEHYLGIDLILKHE